MDAALRALKSGVRGAAREQLQGVVSKTEDQETWAVADTASRLPAALDFFGENTVERTEEAAEDVAEKKAKRPRATSTPTKELKSVVPAPFDQALCELGVTKLTTVQRRVIPLFGENDVLAVAPTGSGKTYAYAVPLLLAATVTAGVDGDKRPRALVLVPTRELAAQVHRVFERLVKAAGLRVRVREAASKGGVAALRGAVADIVVATPQSARNGVDGRLLDVGRVRNVVLDEADRLLDENFLQQVDAVLGRAGSDCKEVAKIHMLSATLPGGVEVLARTLQRKTVKVVVAGGAYGGAAAVTGLAGKIQQTFTFVGGRGEQGKVLAVRSLLRSGLKAPVLVFVQSRERAAQLFRDLVYDGVAVDAIHAERSHAARANAIKRFRDGSVVMLIATDVLARGLDFLGVNTVINYDVPTSATAYVHRIGRTGRNGRSGEAVTLFTEEDRQHLGAILKVAKASGAQVPEWALGMKVVSRKEKVKLLEKRPPKRKRLGGPNAPSIGKRSRGVRVPRAAREAEDENGDQENASGRARSKGRRRRRSADGTKRVKQIELDD